MSPTGIETPEPRSRSTLARTQPTLSHQLAELETQLDTPLFDRSGKSMRLTQAGEIFRAYAKRSIDEMEASCGALAELEGLQRGEIRIGVTQSFVRRLMPPIVGTLLELYPAIRLHVAEMTANQIERQLVEGQLDLGIAFAPTVLDDTQLEPILEERLLLVTGAAHALAERGSVRMAELADVPLVLLNRQYSTRRLIDSYLDAAGCDATAVVSSPDCRSTDSRDESLRTRRSLQRRHHG